MTKIILTVPESLPTAKILETESAFSTIYSEHFGNGSRPSFLWMRMPGGQTFQAGEPSDLFLAMIEVEDGLPQALREPAMWSFANRWTEILGVDLERLMVTCGDRQMLSGYLAGNRARLHGFARVKFVFMTLWHLWRSKSRDGFAQLRANL